MIWSAKSSERESMTCSMPSDLRYSRLRGLPAVAKISAPTCRAIWMAASPTPPEAAWISTRSPGCNWPSRRKACSAVRKQIGIVAASSKLRCSGLGATNSASVSDVAGKAGRGQPHHRIARLEALHSRADGDDLARRTRRPADRDRRDTSSSTLSTSRKFRPVARTRISTWPGPGCWRATGRRATLSSWPRAVISSR